MSTPLVSIILPTYNGSRYIRQSIESCLQQSYTHFELIVVNDCSTDATPQIVEEYAKKDARVKLINNPFNKKLPISLNTGFEAASGQYYTWTSDDNYYAPHAIAAMVEALEKDPTVDLVYADYTLINENNEVTGTRQFGDVNKSFIQWLGAGACFLYKKEIHRAINGYNPAAFLIEDYDFFVRAFMQFRFQYLADTALYYYREHGASLTATQANAINDISKIFLERNLPGLEKKLSAKECMLLHRKLAVHYAVSKNNWPQYRFYLGKVKQASRQQAFVTSLYVLGKKFGYAFGLGLRGIVQSI